MADPSNVNWTHRRSRPDSTSAAARIAAVAHRMFGDELPVQLRAPDGTTIGPANAKATIVFNSDATLRHIVWAPGELGFARAYVAGDLDIEGDLWAVMDLQQQLPDVALRPSDLVLVARHLDVLRRRPPLPAEEVVTPKRFRRHSKASDARSISHHYDVSNDFYRMVLGPSWTYSCAVFEGKTDTLESAQWNKYELISRKLGLRPGARLLDVGCGWGGMVIHAARHHGVRAVGVTISRAQAAKAKERVQAAGLDDQIEIRLQDYRDLGEQPFDAISSIGMFEHVGERQQQEYFDILHSLLRDHGRLLNHQIGRAPSASTRSRVRQDRTHVHRRGFVHRYVFPDGELHEVGDLIGSMQRRGFEVRHMESLREHYALTLRHWVNNLDNCWDEAVDLVGEGRARVWRLYMAASSSLFAAGRIQVHQVLATKTVDGHSGMAYRPTWTGRLGGQEQLMDLRSPATPAEFTPERGQ